MHIGKKIKILRQDKGLTQQQLADKLFISFQSVSNWERHRAHPTTEMMLLIIDEFDLPLDFFIDQTSTSSEDNDEDLILRAFFNNLKSNQTEKPTFKQISETAGIPVRKIKHYYPSYDDLLYAVINHIDHDIKLKVEDSLKQHHSIVFTFINDMVPILYNKKDELHLLYTRPYTRHLWMTFLKSKYISLLNSLQLADISDKIDTEYLIEMLMAFISVWLSHPEPEHLTAFQDRMKEYLLPYT